MDPSEPPAAEHGDGGPLDLHVPGRRLDLAFLAISEIASGSFVRCLRQLGLTVSPPETLISELPAVHWIVSDSHPLTYVDPAFHHRLYQAWIDAAEGPDRVGRARILTAVPIDTDDGVTGPVGWYEAQLVDLVGIEGFDTLIVSLVPGRPDPVDPDGLDDGPTTSVEWLQDTGTFRVRLDRAGRIEGASLNVAEILGRSIADLAETSATDLVHPEDRAFARAAWRTVLITPSRSAPIRMRVATGDGRWRWFDITAWNQLDDPATAAVICEARDVDDQVRAELAGAASNRAHGRLVQVLDQVDDLVLVSRLHHGLVYWNRAADQQLPSLELGIPVIDLLSDALREKADREVVPAIQRVERWSGDLEIKLADGELHVMATTISPVLDPTHDEIYFGVTLRDVTADRSHARALAQQARRDPLTGLPNRLALTELLEVHRGSEPMVHPHHKGHGTRARSTVTLCFIDLDNLKIVNDGLGHSAGDRLLIAVAEQLTVTAREGTVARFGGDEFVVVYADLDPGAAELEAERLLASIGSVEVAGVSTHLTASIGVASSVIERFDPEGLLSDADAAMYAAKHRGRGCVALFDDVLREQVTRRFVLETSLRQALIDGALEMHFQPVVSVASGTIDGFEALARWGLVSPTEFVASAEESGLIIPLGHWVLEESLDALSRLDAHHPSTKGLRLGINVSGRQLIEPSYVERTLETMRDRGIDPSRILLELTESVLIDPREEVDRALRTLCDAGVSLALDDFGSGYSSLGYLRRYPIEALKLDTSYTQALLHDSGTRIIAEAIVTMANRLGLRVVAEGIETPEEFEVVREMGIGWAQGYLLSPALPVDEILMGGLGDLERRIAIAGVDGPPLTDAG